MKKIYLSVILAGILCSFNAMAADEYTQCLDQNYQTTDGLVKCANEEDARIMDKLDKRYGIISNHKYFRGWNNGSHTFAELKSAWLKYRNDFCNLLGYSLEKSNNTYANVEVARCKLKETLRFRNDVENLVKIYQATLQK